MCKDFEIFGKWVGIYFFVENKCQLWVFVGFVYGFYVISELVEFVYKCIDYYYLEFEVLVKYDDLIIGIQWLLVNGEVLFLFGKDEVGIVFVDVFVF